MSRYQQTTRPASENSTAPGAEPGINPRRISSARFKHFKQECMVEVSDYSADDVSVKRLNNTELIHFLRLPNSPQGSIGSILTGAVPIPGGVRWINIGGIDWDVMGALALKYDLHSLALEDVIHEQGHNQSKADYYHAHLFIRILCHTLDSDSDNLEVDHQSEYPPTSSKDSILERGDLNTTKMSVFPEVVKKHLPSEPAVRFTGLTGFHEPARQRQLLKLRALTRGDRVNVKHEPMFIFLLPNGTVISIHPSPNLDFTTPISERILQSDSVLRISADASLLVESLLDLVVDRILEVTDKYQDRIHQLEHDVLLKPRMSTVRSLHILSGDLIMHKRTLEPIKAMLYNLRRYDTDRRIALVSNADAVAGPGIMDLPSMKQKDGDEVKVEGYLSYKAKVYLADVYDHMEFALTSLDMFAAIAENLINYAFNMASYEMNQVMRRLTLATIIFLPLTLLTGYFGMNFQSFSAVNNHSDILFWTIALPVMAALIPVFMFTDIQRIVRYIRKWMAARASIRGYKWAR
ncbi:hypothetical protein BDZ94DRAFT_1291491 [Collybia nuda]|uniref:Magnesium transporter n=1 Tax=Collybia nuda TaxID=64659 RepID=A0A9P6CBK5_9AGAR|nr:hypothetical protein BDZ94DRAFT_1291491 [Collybia nuda]